MSGRFALFLNDKSISAIAASLAALVLLMPGMAQGAGRWDGEWVGTIENISVRDCTIKSSKTSGLRS